MRKTKSKLIHIEESNTVQHDSRNKVQILQHRSNKEAKKDHSSTRIFWEENKDEIKGWQHSLTISQDIQFDSFDTSAQTE